MNHKTRTALRFGVSALIVLIAGCTEIATEDGNKYPTGWKVITTPGNYKAYIVAVEMDDGTKCVVVTANGDGRGITCDWNKAR